MKKKLLDRKNWLFTNVLQWINDFAIDTHFDHIEIHGRENLPQSGAYILIANHTSRWDGPLVQRALGRFANYMVSPNELRGLQGVLLTGVGAFPANPRFDLLEFMRAQAVKGEPIVIFPEGDIYRDGSTHSFKNGASRIALLCAANEMNIPIVPMAIQYAKTRPDDRARMMIGRPIDVREYVAEYLTSAAVAMRSLSTRLHREVCHLRLNLGEIGDQVTVYTGKPVTRWVPRVVPAPVKFV
jgi:1-acyl-sn-glycerol-3-phosphate acyltransferase